MRKLIVFSFAVFASLFIGCAHGQVAPTSFQVALTITPPAASGSWGGCTATVPCSYVVSRAALAAGTTTCPVVNVTTPNYAPLNSASPATSPTYSDTAAAGLTVCYIAQTEQGPAVSVPSNTVGPFVVPASPLAPGLTGAQTIAAKDKDWEELNCSGCRVYWASVGTLGTSVVGAPTLVARLKPVQVR